MRNIFKFKSIQLDVRIFNISTQHVSPEFSTRTMLRSKTNILHTEISIKTLTLHMDAHNPNRSL